MSAEAAARAWAENFDAHDARLPIAHGEAAEVLVAEVRDGAPEQAFSVRGHVRPEYFATAGNAGDNRTGTGPG